MRRGGDPWRIAGCPRRKGEKTSEWCRKWLPQRKRADPEVPRPPVPATGRTTGEKGEGNQQMNDRGRFSRKKKEPAPRTEAKACSGSRPKEKRAAPTSFYPWGDRRLSGTGKHHL